MFLADPLDSNVPLEQGDVCREVPLPIISDKVQLIDEKTGELFNTDVPTTAVLKSRSHILAAVPMVRCHLLILSQSCDLEDAERDPRARVLVAPALPDDDDRFTRSYADAVAKAQAHLTKALVSAVKNPEQTDRTVAKTRASVESSRRKALEDLWLGDVEGAFPIGARLDFGLRRSVCYFDNAISLPATWIPLLKQQRILRLRPEWREVLREKLSIWLGRFAFPGTKKQRLAEAELTTPEAEVPSSKAPEGESSA